MISDGPVVMIVGKVAYGVGWILGLLLIVPWIILSGIGMMLVSFAKGFEEGWDE